LMGRVQLPPELDIPQGHGKVPWLVRAIWEEHAGWFRYESTTELYDVPPSTIWSELVDLAGATGPLLDRARAHVDAGRPLHALHFVDIVLAQQPTDTGALALKLRALEQLLEASGRENFSEVRWLEAEIRDTTAALS
jgi:alkyl sulfatase BDS1-like metallo-beta-lactamase superfamily hydrolase